MATIQKIKGFLARTYQWLIITVLGIALIIIHGFWNNIFMVDAYTIVILFIISIPFLSHFLKRAKVVGAEFEFREEIESTKKVVQQSVEKAKSKTMGKSKPVKFETFNLQSTKKLLDSDPILALASLRIEIERKLGLTVKFFKLPTKRETLSEFIEVLKIKEILNPEQVSALRKIVDMCNKAVHGYTISKEEAKEIVDLADKLNQSFSVGYSIDFSKNENYKKHGLECEWEHCIEFMPLGEERTEKSCPIFGHDCPEGSDKASECEPKALESIAKTIKNNSTFKSKKE
jgi:multisubunit Na+/H+ antiporter MnhG subunit